MIKWVLDQATGPTVDHICALHITAVPSLLGLARVWVGASCRLIWYILAYEEAQPGTASGSDGNPFGF